MVGLGLAASGVAADSPQAPSLRLARLAPIVAPAPAEQPLLIPAIAVAPVEPRDLDCLTAAVYYEARGEALSGQAAVAQVVLNRVGQPAFAGSVCGVVYQGAHTHACQFSFACDGEQRRRHEAAAWSQARVIAARALTGYVMPEVAHATYFHVASLGRVWGKRMAPVAHVGHHIFYTPGEQAAYRTLAASVKRADAPTAGTEHLRGPETAPAIAAPSVQPVAAAHAPAAAPQSAS